MFSDTLATTVVSQPPRFSMSSLSERLQSQPGFLNGVLGIVDRTTAKV